MSMRKAGKKFNYVAGEYCSVKDLLSGQKVKAFRLAKLNKLRPESMHVGNLGLSGLGAVQCVFGRGSRLVIHETTSITRG